MHTTRLVAEGYIPWIVPPPVAEASTGPWTRWEESVDDTLCSEFRFVEASAFEYRYYDRSLRREIYFKEPMEPPLGAMSDRKIFGLPVPQIPFVRNERDQLQKEEPSIWMYDHRSSQGHCGEIASTPPSSHLVHVEDVKLDITFDSPNRPRSRSTSTSSIESYWQGASPAPAANDSFPSSQNFIPLPYKQASDQQKRKLRSSQSPINHTSSPSTGCRKKLKRDIFSSPLPPSSPPSEYRS